MILVLVFSEPVGLKQLIALFVGRTFSEWKDPEVENRVAEKCCAVCTIYNMSGRVVSAYTNSSRRRELYI